MICWDNWNLFSRGSRLKVHSVLVSELIKLALWPQNIQYQYSHMGSSGVALFLQWTRREKWNSDKLLSERIAYHSDNISGFNIASCAFQKCVVAQQKCKKKKKWSLKKTQARGLAVIGLAEGIPTAHCSLPRPAEKVHRPLQNLLFFKRPLTKSEGENFFLETPRSSLLLFILLPFPPQTFQTRQNGGRIVRRCHWHWSG